MLPVRRIEDMTRKRTKNVSAVTHNFDHLKRTAIGARWFCKVLGGKKEDQDIAYVAGLVHDFGRPLSEIEHKDISFTEAQKFLANFSIGSRAKNKILKMVKEHRYSSDKPLMDQCLFLSDKLLEQSGAYIIFRRCVYAGECVDFKSMTFSDAITSHWKVRMKRFHPGMFDKKFATLAEYQYEWQTRFFSAFSDGEEWAVDIAKKCYDSGRNHDKTLAAIISSMKTAKEGKKFKDEALSYIRGRKFRQFGKMVE